MNKEFFEQLAEKENGTFYFQDKDIAIGNGVRSPNVTHKVKFNYKDNQFVLFFRNGTTFTGSIICRLSESLNPIEFELGTRSHLQRLFSRRKNSFIVKSKDKGVQDFFNQNKAFKSLSNVAINEQFYPLINCQFDQQWSINCLYPLRFENWTKVIEAIIELFKNLIDHLFNTKKACN
jgi:hypothetical protein